VTFRLPKDAAPVADMVTIVGDFNNWDLTETQMKKMKNGDFKATLDLPCDREYRFRYLIDSSQWENDWCADKYIPNEHGSDDSVVITINNGG
jgi:1,4-alpha-glucan branching enzyme